MRVLERFALDGRKAVVTGGNQGLGKAFAAALAEAGADVMIVARDTGRNAAAACGPESQGLTVSALDADITRDADAVIDAAAASSAGWTSWSTTPASATTASPGRSPTRSGTTSST